MKKGRCDFCTECRKETGYEFRKKITKQIIKDTEYSFEVCTAVCKECGSEMCIPGLMDINSKLIDRQYRQKENLVSIEDIEDLMEIYNLGKAPVSLALGFGEVTITRYLSGMMPSKKYSYIIKNALESPEYMIELLDTNRQKLGVVAYTKAMQEAQDLKRLFGISRKMMLTISYIFERMEEITPLALQKLLYYVQGFCMANRGVPMFDENCQAWVHGPVYEDVYNLFKSFKYNPIEDNRFAILRNKFRELGEEERTIIDLVVDSFGIYSGKTLEAITHKELPWQNARAACLPDEASNAIIERDEIEKYFVKISREYNVKSVAGIRKYIRDMLEV